MIEAVVFKVLHKEEQTVATSVVSVSAALNTRGCHAVRVAAWRLVFVFYHRWAFRLSNQQQTADLNNRHHLPARVASGLLAKAAVGLQVMSLKPDVSEMTPDSAPGDGRWFLLTL